MLLLPLLLLLPATLLSSFGTLLSSASSLRKNTAITASDGLSRCSSSSAQIAFLEASVLHTGGSLATLRSDIPDDTSPEPVDPCAPARAELGAAKKNLAPARNASAIETRLNKLTVKESKEQEEAALKYEVAARAFQKARAEYEAEAALLHAEMQIVGSCAESSHLAIYHAFQSRMREDPATAQASLLKVASEKVSCSEEKLAQIMPLRKRVLALRAAFVSAKATNDAADARLRSLIEHQFKYAKDQCQALKLQEEDASRKLVQVLESTHSDARRATQKFKLTSKIDDDLLQAVQKGNVAAAHAKVVREAVVSRRKITCGREAQLREEIGASVNNEEDATNDPYKDVDHGVPAYPEVDRLRGESKAANAAYETAREEANIVTVESGSSEMNSRSGSGDEDSGSESGSI